MPTFCSRPNALFLVLGLFSLLCLMPGTLAWSQQTGLNEAKPMHIESDKVIYGQNERRLEFVGQVHVQRPDFQLWCDTMIVTLSEETKQADDRRNQEEGLGMSGRVKKIVALDNVRLEMDKRTATSDRAEFYAQESKIVLLDNVVLKENRNTVHGHKVTFWLDEDRSEIEGKKDSRVKAVFFPEDDEGTE